MGLVHANLKLINGIDLLLFEEGTYKKEAIRDIKVKALVDTGAVMLTINEVVKTQLGVKVREQRSVEAADGRIIVVDVVGPIEVQFKNRRSMVDAVVLPGATEVLLGAIPLEDMDVLVDPKNQALIINPQHPNMPQMSLK